jgi:hypothetical protein
MIDKDQRIMLLLSVQFLSAQTLTRLRQNLELLIHWSRSAAIYRHGHPSNDPPQTNRSSNLARLPAH